MLLADACKGDLNAGATWLNGVCCITSDKVSSVRWSRGLRDRLGMAVEKSDEEVAQDEVLDTDQYLGALTAMQWRGVLHWKAEFALCCAANRGLDAVNSFLAGLNLGKLNDDPPPAVETPLKGDYAYADL